MAITMTFREKKPNAMEKGKKINWQKTINSLQTINQKTKAKQQESHQNPLQKLVFNIMLWLAIESYVNKKRNLEQIIFPKKTTHNSSLLFSCSPMCGHSVQYYRRITWRLILTAFHIKKSKYRQIIIHKENCFQTWFYRCVFLFFDFVTKLSVFLSVHVSFLSMNIH